MLRYFRDNKTLVLKYYSEIKDAPFYDMSRKAIIKTDNQLMDFSASICKYVPYYVRSKGAFIIFYQGGPIYHVTHVTVPVAQSRAESEYNAACTVGMALENFRMLIHEFLNKDTYIFPEEVPLIILDSESAVCMANNIRDTKHTRHIARRIHFVRNGENCKMHKIEWCERGLQLEDIATENVGENDFNSRMKYNIVRLDIPENTCTIGATGERRVFGTRCSI